MNIQGQNNRIIFAFPDRGNLLFGHGGRKDWKDA